MSEQGGFFQFPLCLLASRETIDRWLPRAFHYGVIDFINRTEQAKTDFSHMPEKTKTRCFARAREVIGFSGGDIDDFVRGHRQAENFLLSRSEKTFNVRLKTAYYFETRDQGMLSDRDFRVLVGLYSMIGPKSFAKVGWPMIQARAAGHLSISTSTTYSGPIYSRWQIEQAIAELLDRKFVASVTYNRGERFWSHRLSPEELAAAVTDKKMWMIQSRQARAALNAKTSEAISEATHALITCRSSAGDVPELARSQHVTDTSPSRGASTSPSTLQESPE